jgi:hypothetical protein
VNVAVSETTSAKPAAAILEIALRGTDIDVRRA